MSWRDSTSEQAQADLDALLNAALPFAEEMLGKHGEFFPYAVAIDGDGEAKMVGANPGLGERPASTEVLAMLVDGLRQQRDGLRAVGLVSDVRLERSDAVRVETEHVEGIAITVFWPYTKKRLRRGVEFGDLAAVPGEPQVWVE